MSFVRLNASSPSRLVALLLVLLAAVPAIPEPLIPTPEQKGEVRDFLLGISEIPRDLSKDGVVDAADFVVFNDSPTTLTAQPVSFWFQSDAQEIVLAEHDLPTAAASFWFQDDPADKPANEQRVLVPGRASFWFQQDPATKTANENRILRPDAASFWFQSTGREVREGDAFQQGTPSFERQ